MVRCAWIMDWPGGRVLPVKGLQLLVQLGVPLREQKRFLEEGLGCHSEEFGRISGAILVQDRVPAKGTVSS